ncbi:MAG: ABC-type transport auxiliary lipoprotein family protein [Legionellaceae bacterium]|nr:ABC-type transport auxiliary lipoprotein family protein [Legionellaceae bacterium]
MNRFIYLSLLSLLLITTGCSPVKKTVTNQYNLTLLPYAARHHAHTPYALLISKPEAMAGYRTEQMLYVKQRFTLLPFAKNAWSNPPADMLYPLLVQRFQDSHAFRAITSSPYADKADYRLDTQLIALHQDFLSNKSILKFTAKITVTRISDNRVLASRLLTQNVPCKTNTPYAGVVAANQASSAFVEKTLDFVIRQVQNDKGSHKT